MRPSPLPQHLTLAAAFALLCLALPAAALPPAPEQARLALAADRTAYEPGATARLGALVTIAPGWHVNADKPTFDYLIPTVLELQLPAGWTAASLRYPKAKMQTFAFETQPLAVYDGEVAIVAEVQVPAGTAPGKVPVAAVLSYQACNDSQCLPPTTAEAKLEIAVGPGGKAVESAVFALADGRDVGAAGAAGAGGAPGAESAAAGRDGATAPAGLPWMLALALFGGLILNVMPCVLPVLSLKVFGLVKASGLGRRAVVQGALATAAGILASFWALALAAAAARSAGAAVGWGVQFQRPGFVAFLALVVVLFCLNLWGLFEIPLPQRLARLGGAGPREGLAGHFASGLFATLMATPCSAPFLGTAVGFALAQKVPVIFAIFTAVGLGMALPYLLLAAAPGTARLLPKPGAWMEGVRGVMGFLLAAAAVWLFYVLAAQVSAERVAVVQLGVLLLGLFAWLRNRSQGPEAGLGERRSVLGRLAGIGMAAAVVGTLVVAAGATAGTGGADGTDGTGHPAGRTQSAGLISWQGFDRAEAEELAASGRMVFVDVTADWCFTCKVNERLILETPEVAAAFGEHAVVPMKADWTNRNDEIAAFLAEHGRSGIPFYLLYRPGCEPHVFSELLTKDGLLKEVARNGGKQAAC
jgi:thiol:disulfide interchange protein